MQAQPPCCWQTAPPSWSWRARTSRLAASWRGCCGLSLQLGARLRKLLETRGTLRGAAAAFGAHMPRTATPWAVWRRRWTRSLTALSQNSSRRFRSCSQQRGPPVRARARRQPWLCPASSAAGASRDPEAAEAAPSTPVVVLARAALEPGATTAAAMEAQVPPLQRLCLRVQRWPPPPTPWSRTSAVRMARAEAPEPRRHPPVTGPRCRGRCGAWA
mmetsp:Transcript_91556/g.290400  ORF Transcript_91556/g.290400 Transcript_91556/m.290400 type:complete len:216 (-) Transcript_91556:667-1314(-)